MRTCERIGATVLSFAIAILAASAPDPAHAADPFYENLLRKGTAALAAGEPADAADTIALACFGLLEQPSSLGECLIYLGLAQAEAGQPDALRETFLRVVEIEERFDAYTAAPVPPEVRERFEERLRQHLPEPVLASSPTFAGLVPTRAERLRAMPPRARRAELERLLQTEPADIELRLMLADTLSAEGDPRRARRVLEGAPAAVSGEPALARALGLLLAASGECEAAVAPLSAAGPADPEAAAALLSCLAVLDRHQEVVDAAAALPEGLAAQPEVARLATASADVLAERAADAEAARLAAEAEAAERAAEAEAAERAAEGDTEAAEEAAPEADTTAPPAGRLAERDPETRAGAEPQPGTGPTGPPASPDEPAAPVGLTEDDRADLELGRRLLGASDTRAASELVYPLADRFPGDPAIQLLAAEVAYRLGHWRRARAAFDRSPELPEERPELEFYRAVVLHETGDSAAAAVALERSLPRVRRTPFVDAYAERILAAAARGE